MDSSARRHDLDALRASAMLLGLVLHAGLAYIEFPWTVQDESKSSLIGIFTMFVHGFRMPVFFLMSGFFTAMLWRRRGIGGLLKHRSRRILLPLVIGCLTISPLMFWIGATVSRPQAAAEIEPESTIYDAVRADDVPAVLAHIEEGADLAQYDPEFGQPPLGLAALHGSLSSVEALIDAGADVNAKGGDGGTALHNAAFVGEVEVARRLIEAGADIEAQNNRGNTPAASLEVPWNFTQMLAGFIRLELDEEEVLAGREEIRGMLGVSAEVVPEPLEWSSVISMLMYFPVFHHLWFLWHLCLLVPAFALVAWLVAKVGWSIVPSGTFARRLVGSPLVLLWVVPLTLLPQYFMNEGGFGPDTSAGLIPMPQVIGYYAVFFFFGAVVYEARAAALGRFGWAWLTVSQTVGFVWLTLFSGMLDATQLWVQLLDDVMQVIYTWSTCFMFMGLFAMILKQERPWVRYLSDASYWLYISHLPLVVMLQWWAKPIEAPALVKWIAITAITFGVLMLVYAVAVRHTPIGWLLNGRRKKQAPLQSSTGVNEND